jgi:hypothetical protein
VTIKRYEEYAEPEISSYFYYTLWNEVFAEDYGEMVIPNKCYKIPLKDGKKFAKNTEMMASLEKNHPAVYARFVSFIERNPKRDISAILVPPLKGRFNPFFLEIMDIRAHIAQSMTGYYHLLNGLGIGTVERKINTLVSDFYDPRTDLLE